MVRGVEDVESAQRGQRGCRDIRVIERRGVRDSNVVGWVVGEERSRTREAGVLGNSSVGRQ
jgi:uncharacterized protein YcfJ